MRVGVFGGVVSADPNGRSTRKLIEMAFPNLSVPVTRMVSGSANGAT